MTHRTSTLSAVAAGAAAVALFGLPATANAASGEVKDAAPAAASQAFQDALGEGHILSTSDYCGPHANDHSCPPV
ncbi:hypothetical protein ACWD4G_28595 [Streptomyces sp. NPDC002643]